LRLRLKGPTGIVVAAEGLVRWARRRNPLLPPGAARPGIGVRLDGLGPSAWRELGGTPGAVLTCEELCAS
jgi:hypothetical protein